MTCFGIGMIFQLCLVSVSVQLGHSMRQQKMEEFAENVDLLIKFLKDERYLSDFTKNQKRVLRRQSFSFRLATDGTLQYQDGRKVIPLRASQLAIIEAVHSGIAGNEIMDPCFTT